MAPPPWAAASNDDLYFVLITGANSGVGLGIGQRLIDEFLDARPLSQHLVLIPTTRSKNKSRDTVLALRKHLHASAQKRPSPSDQLKRVHLLSLQLDLCNLTSIYEAADQLVNGKISDPTGLVADVNVPRIDAALFNAGLGGWEGLDWIAFGRQILNTGLVQSTTFPGFKRCLPVAVLDNQKLLGGGGSSAKSPPPLAEVFCANVFGHYVLAHELVPLMSRSNASESPGRVIWTSSIDAGHEHLDFADFQARRYKPPYESSKRITDLLALTADLPSVRPVSDPYFASSSSAAGEKDKPVKPRFYLSHPGIVATPIFPLNRFFFFWYWVVLYVVRWLGSPWHSVDIYLGACATVWLALADQATLDALDAQHIKWGSSTSFTGKAAPKKTELDGWAWEGKIEDEDAVRGDNAEGHLKKSKGRKWDATTLTREQRDEFEAHGRKCWEELETLRAAWERALGRGKV